MKHVLSLYIPDTMNTESLTIHDTSIYTDLIPISCPTLQVLLPGFTSAATFDESSVPPLEPNFIRHFTACDLEVQTAECGTRYDCLPDGIYVIRYSVSPNDIVYVEYNHLRIVKSLKKWSELLCALDIQACAVPAEKNAKWNELVEIKKYLDAAKNAVEMCHKPEKGMELYNYANKLMGKMECKIV